MFKKVTEDAILPTRGSKYAACVDVYANEDVVIGAGETKLIGLGVAIDEHKFVSDITEAYKDDGLNVVLSKIEDFKISHYLQLMLRSSLGSKGLILPNGVGVIDLDYKGEMKMIIHNTVQTKEIVENGVNYTLLVDSDDSEFSIKKGDRIGQITLIEHKSYLFGINTDIERDGGFGSTGER